MWRSPFDGKKESLSIFSSYVKMIQLIHLISCAFGDVSGILYFETLSYPFIFSLDHSPINQLAESKQNSAQETV